MDKIIVLALILGAVGGTANIMLSPDGDLLTAVGNVVNGVVSTLNGLL